MRLSFWPNLQQPAADVLALVDHAERTGWDGVYLADHFMGDGGGFGAVETPTLEATAMISALAARTERVRLGSLVFGATYRHPAVLANWAATTDAVSDGRLVLGLGAGWQVNEHEQYGIELPAPGPRLTRFEEVCTITRSLLTEARSSFAGDTFRLTDAVCEPKGATDRTGPIPLLIGGKGDRMLGIVARHADEWNMWSSPGLLAGRRAKLHEHCDRIGRDPATIAVSTQALVMVTDDLDAARSLVEAVAPRPAVAGPVERFAEMVDGWQEVGVDEVIVPDFVLGRGTRRTDAMDALHAAFRVRR